MATNKKRMALNLKITAELHEAIALNAKKQHRTLNNYAEVILMKATNMDVEL